jgi:hypothetical protein
MVTCATDAKDAAANIVAIAIFFILNFLFYNKPFQGLE